MDMSTIMETLFNISVALQLPWDAAYANWLHHTCEAMGAAFGTDNYAECFVSNYIDQMAE